MAWKYTKKNEFFKKGKTKPSSVCFYFEDTAQLHPITGKPRQMGHLITLGGLRKRGLDVKAEVKKIIEKQTNDEQGRKVTLTDREIGSV